MYIYTCIIYNIIIIFTPIHVQASHIVSNHGVLIL